MKCVVLGKEKILSRQKRITCDLLSMSYHGISLQNSACAGHCMLRGYLGGMCRFGVCRCRGSLAKYLKEVIKPKIPFLGSD